MAQSLHSDTGYLTYKYQIHTIQGIIMVVQASIEVIDFYGYYM